MKILHISGSRSWGGNEQQLCYLIRGLNEKGISQGLLCYEANPVLKVLGEKEIRTFKLDFIKPHKFKFCKFLKKTVEEYHPDILHIHTGNILTGYVIADLLFGISPKVVFSKKGISRNMSFLSRFKYNYHKIAKIVCVSGRVKNSLEDVLNEKTKKKLEIVWDGVKKKQNKIIDLKKEFNLPKDAYIIGNIANHTDSKDLQTFLATGDFLINKKGLSNCYFFQIGNFTKLTNDLKETIENLNLKKHCFLLGFKDQASDYFSALDVFLMSSKKEGGPTSVLEAMLHKTPVVSTNVGIVSIAIENNYNGFYTDVGDFKELAESIEKLYQNKELREQFISKSYKICQETFSTEQLTCKTLNIYKEILN